MDSMLASGPCCHEFDSQRFQNFDVAGVNQRRCLKESGQLLENVNLSHWQTCSTKSFAASTINNSKYKLNLPSELNLVKKVMDLMLINGNMMSK